MTLSSVVPTLIAALLPMSASAAPGVRPDAPEVKRLQRVLNTIGYEQLGRDYGCYAVVGAVTRPVLYLNVTDAKALPKARALLRRYDKKGVARAQLAASPDSSAQRREEVFREVKKRLASTGFVSRITVRLQQHQRQRRATRQRVPGRESRDQRLPP
jgi:hypothetical protein